MERRAGVWWNTWGGLMITLAGALASGLISGFTIYHQFDKRLALLEQKVEFFWQVMGQDRQRDHDRRTE